MRFDSVCSRSLISEPGAGPLLVNTCSFVAFSARATSCQLVDLGPRDICKPSVIVRNPRHKVVATRTCGESVTVRTVVVDLGHWQGHNDDPHEAKDHQLSHVRQRGSSGMKNRDGWVM